MTRTTLILCLVCLCVACTHTVVGGQEYSPNEKFVLIFEMHGTSGKAYTEILDKQVYLFIKERGDNTILLESELVVQAGNLEADANWDSEQQLNLNFYEENGAVRKDIKTLRIVQNDKGEFAVE